MENGEKSDDSKLLKVSNFIELNRGKRIVMMLKNQLYLRKKETILLSKNLIWKIYILNVKITKMLCVNSYA